MEEQQQTTLIDFPNLISNVSHDNINKWTTDIVNMFEDDDKKKLINGILDSVKQDMTPATPDADIVNSFKDMQRRYVHVSLFASLSYMYIEKMLTEVSTKIIANHKQAMSDAKQASGTALREALKIKAEEYRTLETLLQERAQGLSTFITDMAKLPPPIGDAGKGEGEDADADEGKGKGKGADQGGGSKKKKRVQKGGFVRDGTRASLAGDPYPNAS